MLGECLTISIWRNHQAFYHMVVLFYIPPGQGSGSSDCSTSSLTFAIVSLFNFSHLSGCGGVFHCGFNLDFLMTEMLNMSSCACWSFLWLPLPLTHLGNGLSPCRHSLHIPDTSVLLSLTVSSMSRSSGWCLVYGLFSFHVYRLLFPKKSFFIPYHKYFLACFLLEAL